MTDYFTTSDLLEEPLIPSLPPTPMELFNTINDLPVDKRRAAEDYLSILLASSVITGADGNLHFNWNNVSNLRSKIAFWNLFGMRTVGFYPSGKLNVNQYWKCRITIYPGIKSTSVDIKKRVLAIGNALEKYIGDIHKVDYELAGGYKFAYIYLWFYTYEYPNIPLRDLQYLFDEIVAPLSNVLGIDFFFQSEGDIAKEIEIDEPGFIKEHKEDFDKDQAFNWATFIISIAVIILIGVAGIVVVPKLLR